MHHVLSIRTRVMNDADAVKAILIRLRAVQTHLIDVDHNHVDVSVQSRISQIQLILEAALAPHVSLQRLLQYGEFCLYASTLIQSAKFSN